MENIQNKKTFMAIIAMLVIVLIIALAGWVKARNELTELRAGEVTRFEDELAVCDNVQSENDQEACSNKLVEFSALLTKYAEKLKNIQTQDAE